MSIKGFQITEKTTGMLENNKYVFWVDLKDSKNKIKDTVEKRFNVEVKKINTQKLKGKETLSQRRIKGRKKDRKKAIVTLKKGQKIKEFESEGN